MTARGWVGCIRTAKRFITEVIKCMVSGAGILLYVGKETNLIFREETEIPMECRCVNWKTFCNVADKNIKLLRCERLYWTYVYLDRSECA